MTPVIRFFNEGINLQLPIKRKLRIFFVELLKSEGKKTEDLNFIFCNDDYLSQLNLKYLGRDYLTDVIAFEHDSAYGGFNGDIYISVQRTRENARIFNVSYRDELLRVMIHGVLHLVGYKDKTDSQKRSMRSVEDRYIGLFKEKFPE